MMMQDEKEETRTRSHRGKTLLFRHLRSKKRLFDCRNEFSRIHTFEFFYIFLLRFFLPTSLHMPFSASPYTRIYHNSPYLVSTKYNEILCTPTQTYLLQYFIIKSVPKPTVLLQFKLFVEVQNASVVSTRQKIHCRI